MSSNLMADGSATAGKKSWSCLLRRGPNQGDSIFGARKLAAHRKVRREPSMIAAGSAAGRDTRPRANTIPPSTTEQSNRINTAKQVPFRLHSFSIDQVLEENSATAAMLRAAMTLSNFSH